MNNRLDAYPDRSRPEPMPEQTRRIDDAADEL